MPQIISSLSDISDSFDAIICDLWGVLHDGERVYPRAMKAIKTFLRSGRKVVVLSNSPRQQLDVVALMRRVGIDDSGFEDIVSSGHLLQHYLRGNFQDKVYFHLGAKRDRFVLTNISQTETNDASKADFIICTGLESGDQSELDALTPFVRSIAKEERPMICVNPDRIVHVGNFVMICAGALADIYQDAGGAVIWMGKPDLYAYNYCAASLGTDRILAIGDGLHTDIQGANNYGVQSLFIYGGVHRDTFTSDSDVQNQLNYEGAIPTYAMFALT